MYTNGISLQYKYISDIKVGNTHPSPIFNIDIDNLTVDLLNTTTYELDGEVGGVIDKHDDGNENSQTYNNEENVDLNDNPQKILTNLRRKNLYRPVIGHININFLYGKYEALRCLIKDKLDVLVVTEIKLNESYPSSQFHHRGIY